MLSFQILYGWSLEISAVKVSWADTPLAFSTASECQLDCEHCFVLLRWRCRRYSGPKRRTDLDGDGCYAGLLTTGYMRKWPVGRVSWNSDGRSERFPFFWRIPFGLSVLSIKIPWWNSLNLFWWSYLFLCQRECRRTKGYNQTDAEHYFRNGLRMELQDKVLSDSWLRNEIHTPTIHAFKNEVYKI